MVTLKGHPRTVVLELHSIASRLYSFINQIAPPASVLSPMLLIDSVGIRSSSKKSVLQRSSFKSPAVVHRQEEDKHILGFRDHEKVTGIPNATVPLLITTVVANRGSSSTTKLHVM